MIEVAPVRAKLTMCFYSWNNEYGFHFTLHEPLLRKKTFKILFFLAFHIVLFQVFVHRRNVTWNKNKYCVLFERVDINIKGYNAHEINLRLCYIVVIINLMENFSPRKAIIGGTILQEQYQYYKFCDSCHLLSLSGILKHFNIYMFGVVKINLASRCSFVVKITSKNLLVEIQSYFIAHKISL
jgi:hypothetical protein